MWARSSALPGGARRQRASTYPAEREEKGSSKQKQKIRVLPTQHWTHISCSPMGSALAIHSKTSRPTRHKKSTHTNILMKLESHKISTTLSTSVIRQLDKRLDLSTVLIELFHFSLSLEFEIAFRKNIQRQVYSKEFVAPSYCLTSFWHSFGHHRLSPLGSLKKLDDKFRSLASRALPVTGQFSTKHLFRTWPRQTKVQSKIIISLVVSTLRVREMCWAILKDHNLLL